MPFIALMVLLGRFLLVRESIILLQALHLNIETDLAADQSFAYDHKDFCMERFVTTSWQPDIEHLYTQVQSYGIVAPFCRLVMSGFRFLATRLCMPSLLVCLLLSFLGGLSAMHTPMSAAQLIFHITTFSMVFLTFTLIVFGMLFDIHYKQLFAALSQKWLQVLFYLLFFHLLPLAALVFIPVLGYVFALYYFISASYGIYLVLFENANFYQAILESLTLTFGRWCQNALLYFLPVFLYFCATEGLLYMLPDAFHFSWTSRIIHFAFLMVLIPWLSITHAFLFRYWQKHQQQLAAPSVSQSET